MSNATYIPKSEVVYKIFSDICKIPRPSHHEEKIADYLCRFAKEHNLSFKRDQNNCVLISRESNIQARGAKVTMLTHCDMVCVADDGIKYNPLTDGIAAVQENGWITAKGTSLGADNGIGMAMALAVMSDEKLECGPIDALFTTNEEDGMSGAQMLDTVFFGNIKYILNLDSEDYDTITTGSAGAYIQEFHLSQNPAERAISGAVDLEINITGGLGGHSGVDIDKNRANCILVMAEMLRNLSQNHNFDLIFLKGGSAAASIPSECSAKIGVSEYEKDRITAYMVESFSQLKNQYRSSDSGIKLGIREKNNADGPAVDNKTAVETIETIAKTGAGVIETRKDGLPLTSNNIGIINLEPGNGKITTHTRSFDDNTMRNYAEYLSKEFSKSGWDTKKIMESPAWVQEKETEFMKIVNQSFSDAAGFTPRPVEMHFVLEAGFFKEKYKDMEMASIGPRIQNPHSTSERVEIKTIENIWKVLIEILYNLSRTDL